MSGLFSLDSWSTVWTHRESFLLGLSNTLQTAVCALALAFIIGAALGLMSTSGNKPLRIVARIYVEFIQNTPLLLQLCFLYYALAFAGVSLGVIRTGIIALGVYTGAYMGEVVRAAIESVPKGQFEAAAHTLPLISSAASSSLWSASRCPRWQPAGKPPSRSARAA